MEYKNLTEEKSADNQKPQELLPSMEEEKRLMSGKEFIATTPIHELQNVFGIIDKDLPEQKNLGGALPTDSKNQNEPAEKFSFLPKLRKKNPPLASVTIKPKENAGAWKKIFRFLEILVLIITLIVIGLYIWGGVLKNGFQI
jgi:hypothetical protein